MKAADVEPLILADGSRVTIRPVRADDAPLLQTFFRRLSSRSRRFRFFSALVELSASELERLVRVDQERELVLVALTAQAGNPTIVAEARCVVDAAPCSAEFALAVTDEFQRRGLGTQLVKRLFAYAAKRGVRRLFGEVLVENRPMLALARRLGFRIRPNASDATTVIASVLPVNAMAALSQP